MNVIPFSPCCGWVRPRHFKLIAGMLIAATCSTSLTLSVFGDSASPATHIRNSPGATSFSLDDSSALKESKVATLTREGWSRVKLDLIPPSERASRSDRGYPSVSTPKGAYGVEGHGLPRSVFARNGDAMSASELASMITNDSRYEAGMTVYLMCCETGKGRRSFAQQLANTLGTEVVAPTEKLWPLQNGTYLVAPMRRHDEFGMYSGEQADTSRPGGMKAFKPSRGSAVMVAASREDKSERNTTSSSSSVASSSKTQDTPQKESLTGMAKTAALLAELHGQRNSTRFLNSKGR